MVSGAEGAQHEQAMEMFRGDYRPQRWTRLGLGTTRAPFSPLVVVAVLAFLLTR